jgi:hypothetical protein
MFAVFQIIAVLLVAIAMSSAVGHAMEFPGKLRLSKQEYLAVQPIYYPGYTIFGGAGEALGLIVTLVWAGVAYGTPQFPLVLAAFVAMVAMHATYWIFTHPVNRFWLEHTRLGSAGEAFFSTGAGEGGATDWRQMRDRWEYSHVARAVFSTLALLFLVIALTVH